LLISGSSTFRKTRLDDWESSWHKSQVWLHPGVLIKPDLSRPNWAVHKRRIEVSKADRESIRGAFGRMGETNMNEGGWWRSWRAPLACILGLLSGGGAFTSAFATHATGAFVNFAWGSMSFSAGAASFVAVGGAAGGAILLGCGAAAAVYFIPWEGLFDFFQVTLSWLWGKISSLWDKLYKWCSSSSTPSRQTKHWGHIPMAA
jgi:hypothetical protein